MTALITFLFTTIPALFTFLLTSFARKYSTVVSAFFALSVMLVIFVSCINVIVTYVIGLMVMPAWLLTAVGMFIPGNFALVLGAVVSGRICRAVFDHGRTKLKLLTSAT